MKANKYTYLKGALKMTIAEKVKRYKEIEAELDEYQKRPVADRVKPNGPLEKAILAKMKKGKDIIAKRSEDVTVEKWEHWDKLKDESIKLREELEDAQVIFYTADGDEIIKDL
jgi:hypothetical protein